MTLANETDMVLQYSVALLRAQRLGANCAPLTGANDRIVTAGAVSIQATPVYREGAELQWETGAGVQVAEIVRDSQIRRWDLTCEIVTPDMEFMELLFGGQLDVADVGHANAGDTVAYAPPDLTSAAPNGVYLEVVGELTYEGAGECATVVGPPYRGHIFPRFLARPGDVNLQDDTANLSFTGRATANPTASLDPFGDYPGAANAILSKPYIAVDYLQTEFDAMVALAAPGTQTAA